MYIYTYVYVQKVSWLELARLFGLWIFVWVFCTVPKKSPTTLQRSPTYLQNSHTNQKNCPKKRFISAKEPYVSVKEPYISTKQPCTSTKKSQISAKSPLYPQKSPLNPQKSPTYPKKQTRWYVHICIGMYISLLLSYRESFSSWRTTAKHGIALLREIAKK